MLRPAIVLLAFASAPAAPASRPAISPMTLVIIGVSFVIVVGGVLIVGRAIRKLLRAHESDVRGDWTAPKANEDNPSAFMAASMQGVIEKLRDQERELGRM